MKTSHYFHCGLLLAGLLTATLDARASGEQRFTSPAEAVKALTTATETKNITALQAIFGQQADEIVSPDQVQASQEFRKFAELLAAKSTLAMRSGEKEELLVGVNDWPFPVPLVKDGSQWFFDTAAGLDEISNRRIGANELDALRLCRNFVDAQREYASRDRDGDKVLEYAQHIRSTPGTRDGLYWPAVEGEELSPIGPLIALSEAEGYTKKPKTEGGAGYHGYRFKILTKQGKQAPGGKYDYVINGHMIGGFALVAWPMAWDESGVMTFIVNQQGQVFQKNLGPKTTKLAEAMTTYEPDATWQEVP